MRGAKSDANAPRLYPPARPTRPDCLPRSHSDQIPAFALRVGLRARFSKPLYPGETLCTDIWREARGLAGFRCRVVERGVVVLDNGLLEYEEA